MSTDAASRRAGAPAVAPSVMRGINQRLLLDHLVEAGPATRPQLTRLSGLSLPTVTAALADLEKAGLVRLSTPPDQTIGRPAAAYEVDPRAGYVAAVDIGRAWLRLSVSDLVGTELARVDVRNTSRSAPALVDLVAQAVTDVIGRARLGATDITHTVIGSPGVLDEKEGRLLYAANLPGWHRVGLAAALTDRLGSDVTIDNDANLAALAEHRYGVAMGASDFVYVHIGTGIGIGIYLNGHVYRGANGAAGEVAYLPFGANHGQPSGPRAMRGILEEALAADAVVRYAKAAGMTGRLTSERVFAAARAGDSAARAALAQEAELLAQLVASVCAFLDPEMIVFGGGVGQNIDLLEPQTSTALARLSPLRARLVPSALGVEAVTRGALARGLAIARERTFVDRIAQLRP